jgi:hypothetical protein
MDLDAGREYRQARGQPRQMNAEDSVGIRDLSEASSGSATGSTPPLNWAFYLGRCRRRCGRQERSVPHSCSKVGKK